ncbi:MAG: dynamin family protein [Ferrimonas sp.]
MDSTALDRRLDRLDEIFIQFSDLCDAEAHKIKEEHCKYNSSEVRNHLASLQDRERLLKVGIIGRVKAGKSSLINALLFDGKDVLPKAATPMTAALTTLGYSDTFRAEVEFFSPQDLKKIKSSAAEYERSLKQEIEQQRIEASRRQEKSTLSATEAQNTDNTRRHRGQKTDEDRLYNRAKRKVEQSNLTGAAAFDLYQRIKNSPVSATDLLGKKILEVGSERELNQILHDYVGSDGQYMPFTKTLHVGLPKPSLQDMLVIDTPGLSDAVASRERRTYEMLKECNVVFIVSPAGQFLNAHDLELANRLSQREGIQEIYIVASQVDTQVHSSEREKHNGELPRVISSLTNILSSQAVAALRSQNNPVLRNVAAEQDKRVFVTSGMCQSLLAQSKSDWDQTAQHTYELLNKNYPEAFSTPEAREESLRQLAGQKQLMDAITAVRYQKSEIVEKQLSHFLQAQQQSLNKLLPKLIAHFDALAERVEATDLAAAKAQLDNVISVQSKGSDTANDFFQQRVESLELELPSNLTTHLTDFEQAINGKVGNAEGTKTETYKKEKSGCIHFLGRIIGFGGYEDVTRTYTTVNAYEIRDALEKTQRFMQEGLFRISKLYIQKWRESLTSELLYKLRGELGDNAIDGDRLTWACKNSIKKIQQISEPKISPITDELAQSGKLQGAAAEAYIIQAREYLFLVRREGHDFIHTIEGEVRALQSFNLGEKLFEELRTEIEIFQEMVTNKRNTIEKLKILMAQLDEVVE